MKAFILALVILTTSTASMACSCQRPNFTEVDAVKAIAQHLEVSDNTSLKVQEIKSRTFLTKENKRELKPFKGNAWLYACARGCSEIQNRKSIYAVSFEQNGTTCSGKIKVTMISKEGSNFDSKVKGRVNCQ